jgi:hypothetical protein
MWSLDLMALHAVIVSTEHLGKCSRYAQCQGEHLGLPVVNDKLTDITTTSKAKV